MGSVISFWIKRNQLVVSSAEPVGGSAVANTFDELSCSSSPYYEDTPWFIHMDGRIQYLEAENVKLRQENQEIQQEIERTKSAFLSKESENQRLKTALSMGKQYVERLLDKVPVPRTGREI